MDLDKSLLSSLIPHPRLHLCWWSSCMGGIRGQCPALSAQGVCLGAVGMGLGASSLLQDSSFPSAPPQKLKGQRMLMRAWPGWSPVAHPALPRTCTILSGHTHSITVGAPKIAFAVFNCTLPASVSPHFKWCYYLPQWAVMINVWTSLTCFAKERCCMLSALSILIC